MTRDELKLVNILQNKVNEVLSFVSSNEKILRKEEGSLTIHLSQNGNKFWVKIDSYIMLSSNFKTEYSSNSLKNALQQAIKGVEYWGTFEKESCNTLSFISKDRQEFIQSYL